MTISGRPDIARVMQLLEDGERLRERLQFPPSVVGRLWSSYLETGEYTRRQVQGRSRVRIFLSRRVPTESLSSLVG